MKFITLIAALAAAIPAAIGANITINSPANVVACQPTQFVWSGGVGPYFLSLLPPGQIQAPAIKDFPTQTGTSYTWLVDLAQGTSFTGEVKDSQGNTAYTSIITIEPGTTLSCINNNVTETGSGGSGTASTASGSSPTGTSASSSATSTSSSKSSDAGRLGVSSAFGVAGIMGLVGAALF